jgi:hypothetical protein
MRKKNIPIAIFCFALITAIVLTAQQKTKGRRAPEETSLLTPVFATICLK